MAFDSLTEKLQNVFKNLRSKGRLTEDDVKEALKEIKRALLAADVNFKVVKDFIKSVQERAIGQDVMNGLNPGQVTALIFYYFPLICVQISYLHTNKRSLSQAKLHNLEIGRAHV